MNKIRLTALCGLIVLMIVMMVSTASYYHTLAMTENDQAVGGWFGWFLGSFGIVWGFFCGLSFAFLSRGE